MKIWPIKGHEMFLDNKKNSFLMLSLFWVCITCQAQVALLDPVLEQTSTSRACKTAPPTQTNKAAQAWA
jgi:hypothetical protein